MTRGKNSRARRSLILAVLTAGFAVLAFTAAPGGAASPQRAVIGGATPALPPARELGAVPAGKRLRLTVVLSPRHDSQLSAFATAVSTPGSPSYRHFLNVHQFAARFGASESAIATVRRTLQADGLQVGTARLNRLSLPVFGDAAHVSRAFGVHLRRFRENSGLQVFANTSAPSVPASLHGIVSTVLGLNSLPAAVPEGLTDASGAKAHAAANPFANGQGPVPCPAASSYASGAGEYTINQIASAYGLNGLYAQGDYGQGATIAMYELEGYPTLANDIGNYQSCYQTNTPIFLAAPVDGGPGTPVPANPGPGEYVPSAETSVDLENVIGLAPQASIVIYQGPNNYPGNYDTLSRIVTDDLAQVVNDSWGVCEQDQVAGLQDSENTLLRQAMAEGMSFLSSTGDRGSQGCVAVCPPSNSGCSLWLPVNDNGPLQVDDPASQPYATGVGGSDLTSVSPPIETGWNEPFWGGSGGGISTKWVMPTYQADAGMPGTINSYTSGDPCGAGPQPCREVPDVSADGAPHQGYTIYWNGKWAAAGGTSTAAPVWAAIIALADADDTAPCTGNRLGFLNPLLYEIAAGTEHASAFRDITSGDNNPAETGPYPATPGYDMTTGLGTPIVTAGSSPGLVSQLCDAAARGIGPAPTITSLSAPEASAGAQITVTGTGFTPYSAVWFGNSYASTVSYVDPQHLLATVPPGTGSTNVQVLKISGVSINGPQTAFTYAPTETITSPSSGGAYTQGQPLSAFYTCASSTAGAPTCAGTQPIGAAIDTSTTGRHQFSVTATDANGFPTTTTATYTVVAPPAVAISGPTLGATYAQGQVLTAQFSCSTSAPVTIASCSAPVAPGAAVDTQAVGAHSFTVAATDSNGITTSRTVTYQVVAPPHASISRPSDGSTFVRGSAVTAAFACSAIAPATIVSCAANTLSGENIDTSTIGAHHLTATATDSDGDTTSATIGYNVVGVQPLISGLREASAHWVSHGTKRTRLPIGTTFSFTLDQNAKVTLGFSRQGSGRMKAGRCVAAAKTPARARRCALKLAAGNFAVNATRGGNSISFSGRTSSGNLVAGSYTVTLTAVGLSGTPSAPLSLRFTLATAG
jgi:subtilase family serine protease